MLSQPTSPGGIRLRRRRTGEVPVERGRRSKLPGTHVTTGPRPTYCGRSTWTRGCIHVRSASFPLVLIWSVPPLLEFTHDLQGAHFTFINRATALRGQEDTRAKHNRTHRLSVRYRGKRRRKDSSVRSVALDIEYAFQWLSPFCSRGASSGVADGMVTDSNKSTSPCVQPLQKHCGREISGRHPRNENVYHGRSGENFFKDDD